MRTIGVVTVARSDYSIYLPILRKIQAHPELNLHLIVAGMHLSPEFGLTVKDIEVDGFQIAQRVEMSLSSDTPEGISKSIGLGVIGFAQAYAHFRPDILMVLGDRFEMLAAVVAATPYVIPIAHLHGGETTEGAIDEAFRHSITKMSHLHFVSTNDYGKRLIQMGEEPWRVTVSGAPSLDNLQTIEWLTVQEIEQKLEMSLSSPPLLVTYHPVTLEHNDTSYHILELLAALEMVDLPIVFTYPNADTSGRVIIQAIDQFVQTHERSRKVANLGATGYFSLMKYALAMVGNSSSGIIEAASFELPVVNIGNRQRGRIHGHNVVNVSYDRHSIANAICEVTSPAFRSRLKGMQNPYGDGHASERVVEALQATPLNKRLILKRFYNIE
jgi:UDP-hydrolysing UDP-N-acetyl-D-glucosamine 2-epimerase